MASDGNVWIPLLSTLAGGAIAFLSVHLSGKQQNALTLKKEGIERRLSKAEELYSLILKFEQEMGCWRLALIEDDATFLNTGLDLPQHQQHKIGLIVHIHFPELGNLADCVLEKKYELRELVEVWIEETKKRKKSDNNNIEAIETAYTRLIEAADKLKEGISSAVKNY